MKTFGIFVVAVLLQAAAFADAITSPGASFVSVPLGFQSTTGSNGGQGAPFWNNYSSDGINMNAGDFLTGSNPVMGLTNYLSSAGDFGKYLSTGSSGLDAPTNFSFLQSGTTIDVTLLYANAGANMTSTYGTQIGLYNVADPSQKVILYSHGSLYNYAPGANGIFNNNVDPQGTATVTTFPNYGVFAQSCGFNTNGSIFCNTYYSNSALNPESNNEGSHQHFALFENAQNSAAFQTYYLAFDDGRGMSPTEGYGDYNDVIIRFITDDPPTIDGPPTETTAVPEPATFSVLGIGLVGLGLLRRFRSKQAR